MKTATGVLRHEHEAIVLALRVLAELSRAFERFEVQVMGRQRHEALHSLLMQLQTRYSV